MTLLQHFLVIHILTGTLLLSAGAKTAFFDKIQKACPFTNFCSVKSLKSHNSTDGSLPCCANCSCDKDCWIFDDCCPDVVHDKPSGLNNLKCSRLTVDNSFRNSLTTYMYRVVDFCPRDYDDVENRHVIEQCEGRFTGNVDFTDVVAVSDSRHRIYKNKHCALCHGIKDYVSWRLSTWQCFPDLNTIAPSRVVEYVLENCFLWSRPPNTFPYGGRYSLCGKYIEADCPDSNSMESKNDCINGPYMPYFFKKRQFKNILCAQCSKFWEGHEQCVDMFEDDSKSPVEMFSLLLDMTVPEKLSKPQISSTCSETEIYDDVQSTCTRLFCPALNVAWSGRCIELGSLFGTTVALQLLYECTDRPVINSEVKYDPRTTRTSVIKFSRQFGLQKCTITSFFISLILERDTQKLSYATFDIMVEINARCQLEDYAKAVRNHIKVDDPIAILILSDEVKFRGGISFNVDPQVLKNSGPRLVLLDWLGISLRPRHSFKIGFFLCPYFIVNKDRYTAIISEVFTESDVGNLTEITTFSLLIDGFYPLSNESIAMCVDTYFGLYKKNEGPDNLQGLPIVLLGVIFVSSRLLLKL